MKRYMLFAGYDYYPCGGWRDLVGTYLTLYEALAAAKLCSGTWKEIIDKETDEQVFSEG